MSQYLRTKSRERGKGTHLETICAVDDMTICYRAVLPRQQRRVAFRPVTKMGTRAAGSRNPVQIPNQSLVLEPHLRETLQKIKFPTLAHSPDESLLAPSSDRPIVDVFASCHPGRRFISIEGPAMRGPAQWAATPSTGVPTRNPSVSANSKPNRRSDRAEGALLWPEAGRGVFSLSIRRQ